MRQHEDGEGEGAEAGTDRVGTKQRKGAGNATNGTAIAKPYIELQLLLREVVQGIAEEDKIGHAKTKLCDHQRGVDQNAPFHAQQVAADIAILRALFEQLLRRAYPFVSARGRPHVGVSGRVRTCPGACGMRKRDSASGWGLLRGSRRCGRTCNRYEVTKRRLLPWSHCNEEGRQQKEWKETWQGSVIMAQNRPHA